MTLPIEGVKPILVKVNEGVTSVGCIRLKKVKFFERFRFNMDYFRVYIASLVLH